MHATQRIPSGSVIDRLLREPRRFELVQAVRLLHAWLGEGNEDGCTARIRFRNRVDLSFSASEIDAIDVEWESDGERCAANVKVVTITPGQISLFGSTGDLPYALTERVLQTDADGRMEAVRSFFDLLSGRTVATHMMARSHGRGADAGLLDAQAALGGMHARPPITPAAAGFHAATMGRPSVSAVNLQIALQDHFDVPVQVCQFEPEHHALKPAERSLLGTRNCMLGSSWLGRRVPLFQHRLRLRLGPLGRECYTDFMPGMPGQAALAAFIALFKLAPTAIDVELLMRTEERRPLAFPFRLGYSDYLGRQPADAGGYVYTLSPS
ncbi:MAG TPA: type VI secretion system baseplate subunit TssG [Telluria sp.]|nr:type VI secretion system baseplate subunit TssG [Telluria sp.]